jgi:aminopeptidase-like protein
MNRNCGFIGKEMYSWANDLFPICRSITGQGLRETLHYIKEKLENLKIISVPSGTKIFDWVVPDEWIIRDAYIKTIDGEIIVDFKNNNLHIVNYSRPINKQISYNDLKHHLHTLPDRPNSIPYHTSYYKKEWGFCLTQHKKDNLKEKQYIVKIDSEFIKGSLDYGELVVHGKTKKEILFSTYICHPSMANNELSGPVVTLALARWVASLKERHYTYRFVFVPETIGAIAFLFSNYEELKKRVCAGFVVSCVGDEGAYSYLSSKYGNTLSDRVAKIILDFHGEKYNTYSYFERGSDERQYCSPGIDLPVCSVMRSKYGSYPEYHTSDDNMSLISPKGLQGSFDIYTKIIKLLEGNKTYCASNKCEPKLSKYNLRPTLGATRSMSNYHKLISNILAYSDGDNDIVSLSSFLKTDPLVVIDAVKTLLSHKLIHEVN